MEPMRLVPRASLVFVAYDLDRLDWRTFRVDRLRNAKQGKRSFRPRDIPGGDAGEFVRASLQSVWESHQVKVLVHAPVDLVTERIGRWAHAEEREGGCLVTMQVEDARWVAMAMGSLDADYEFVEIPVELVHEIRGRNAQVAGAVSGGSGDGVGEGPTHFHWGKSRYRCHACSPPRWSPDGRRAIRALTRTALRLVRCRVCRCGSLQFVLHWSTPRASAGRASGASRNLPGER